MDEREKEAAGAPPGRPPGRGLALLGALLLAAGLLFNVRAVGRLFADGGELESLQFRASIMAIQLVLVLAGAILIWGRDRLRVPPLLARAALVGVLVVVLVGAYGSTLAPDRRPDPVDAELYARWQRMLDTEELLLALTPRMGWLSRSIKNLQLPDHESRRLFADELTVNDLAAGELPKGKVLASLSAEVRTWPVSDEPRTGAPETFRLWTRLLEDAAYWEHAKFYIVRADFIGAGRDDYEADVAFTGVIRRETGGIRSVKGKQKMRFKRIPEEQADGDELPWRMYAWHLEEIETIDAPDLLFVDVLDRVISDPDQLAMARRSIHEELVAKFLVDPDSFEPPHPHFELPAFDRHPGLAVVDYDGDGFDDFYVMVRLGRNMFFRNRGDGTFEEIAEKIGLDIDGYSSSGVFADFNNNGRPDLLLGRTLRRSMYLVNEGGRFVDRSDELAGGRLPYLVSSVAAADYDGDGLLDAYFGTYAAGMTDSVVGMVRMRDRLLNKRLLPEFLEERDARELYRRAMAPGADRTTNHAGPPNVLVRNSGGGRLAVVDDVPELKIFMNTYQATWADYDGDGLPDIYVANDFGPNQLVRNLGGGRFADMTAATGTADIGFGMGAGWGDYNNDGRQDLYVSNMFSKAGRRIMGQLESLDPTFREMARGNTLFRNDGAGFEKVSGEEPPTLTVEVAGWAWGGNFVDADNDGWLDVFSLSGHYTAPVDIAGAVDI
ncbi:hypothetical protein BH23GEM9_BH23GEM9_00390 [soil metagenome]